MSTFQRCPKQVSDLAAAILAEFETHSLTLKAGVKFDFVFALGDRDDKGVLISDAIKKGGVIVRGVARKIPLKDRALGRADAEIMLDGDWWEGATDAERKALLDHELHHICPKLDKRGLVTDDLGRPVLLMRQHDFEFGWFTIIAQRHGIASQERIQAKRIADSAGQFYWPEFISPSLPAAKPKKLAAK